MPNVSDTYREYSRFLETCHGDFFRSVLRARGGSCFLSLRRLLASSSWQTVIVLVGNTVESHWSTPHMSLRRTMDRAGACSSVLHYLAAVAVAGSLSSPLRVSPAVSSTGSRNSGLRLLCAFVPARKKKADAVSPRRRRHVCPSAIISL
jgi:hypothetical protein